MPQKTYYLKSPTTGKEYPVEWTQPTEPTDDDFKQIISHIEQTEKQKYPVLSAAKRLPGKELSPLEEEMAKNVFRNKTFGLQSRVSGVSDTNEPPPMPKFQSDPNSLAAQLERGEIKGLQKSDPNYPNLGQFDPKGNFLWETAKMGGRFADEETGGMLSFPFHYASDRLKDLKRYWDTPFPDKPIEAMHGGARALGGLVGFDPDEFALSALKGEYASAAEQVATPVIIGGLFHGISKVEGRPPQYRTHEMTAQAEIKAAMERAAEIEREARVREANIPPAPSASVAEFPDPTAGHPPVFAGPRRGQFGYQPGQFGLDPSPKFDPMFPTIPNAVRPPSTNALVFSNLLPAEFHQTPVERAAPEGPFAEPLKGPGPGRKKVIPAVSPLKGGLPTIEEFPTRGTPGEGVIRSERPRGIERPTPTPEELANERRIAAERRSEQTGISAQEEAAIREHITDTEVVRFHESYPHLSPEEAVIKGIQLDPVKKSQILERAAKAAVSEAKKVEAEAKKAEAKANKKDTTTARGRFDAANQNTAGMFNLQGFYEQLRDSEMGRKLADKLQKAAFHIVDIETGRPIAGRNTADEAKKYAEGINANLGIGAARYQVMDVKTGTPILSSDVAPFVPVGQRQIPAPEVPASRVAKAPIEPKVEILTPKEKAPFEVEVFFGAGGSRIFEAATKKKALDIAFEYSSDSRGITVTTEGKRFNYNKRSGQLETFGKGTDVGSFNLQPLYEKFSDSKVGGKLKNLIRGAFEKEDLVPILPHERKGVAPFKSLRQLAEADSEQARAGFSQEIQKLTDPEEARGWLLDLHKEMERARKSLKKNPDASDYYNDIRATYSELLNKFNELRTKKYQASEPTKPRQIYEIAGELEKILKDRIEDDPRVESLIKEAESIIAKEMDPAVIRDHVEQLRGELENPKNSPDSAEIFQSLFDTARDRLNQISKKFQTLTGEQQRDWLERQGPSKASGKGIYHDQQMREKARDIPVGQTFGRVAPFKPKGTTIGSDFGNLQDFYERFKASRTGEVIKKKVEEVLKDPFFKDVFTNDKFQVYSKDSGNFITSRSTEVQAKKIADELNHIEQTEKYIVRERPSRAAESPDTDRYEVHNTVSGRLIGAYDTRAAAEDVAAKLNPVGREKYVVTDTKPVREQRAAEIAKKEAAKKAAEAANKLFSYEIYDPKTGKVIARAASEKGAQLAAIRESKRFAEPGHRFEYRKVEGNYRELLERKLEPGEKRAYNVASDELGGLDYLYEDRKEAEARQKELNEATYNPYGKYRLRELVYDENKSKGIGYVDRGDNPTFKELNDDQFSTTIHGDHFHDLDVYGVGIGRYRYNKGVIEWSSGTPKVGQFLALEEKFPDNNGQFVYNKRIRVITDTNGHKVITSEKGSPGTIIGSGIAELQKFYERLATSEKGQKLLEELKKATYHLLNEEGFPIKGFTSKKEAEAKLALYKKNPRAEFFTIKANKGIEIEPKVEEPIYEPPKSSSKRPEDIAPEDRFDPTSLISTFGAIGKKARRVVKETASGFELKDRPVTGQKEVTAKAPVDMKTPWGQFMQRLRDNTSMEAIRGMNVTELRAQQAARARAVEETGEKGLILRRAAQRIEAEKIVFKPLNLPQQVIDALIDEASRVHGEDVFEADNAGDAIRAMNRGEYVPPYNRHLLSKVFPEKYRTEVYNIYANIPFEHIQKLSGGMAGIVNRVVGGFYRNTIGSAKTLKATFDASVVGVQGRGAMDTPAYYSAYSKGWKAFKDQKVFDAQQRARYDSPWYKFVTKDMGVHLADLEKEGLEQFKGGNPRLERAAPIVAFHRGAIAFLNHIRFENAIIQAKLAVEKGIGLEETIIDGKKVEADIKNIGRFINESTGYGSLSKKWQFDRAEKAASHFLWSPRLVARTINYTKLFDPREYKTPGARFAQQKRLRSALMIAGTSLAFMKLLELNGWKSHYNPFDPKFGKSEKDDTVLDTTSSFGPLVALVFRSAQLGITGKTKDAKGKDLTELTTSIPELATSYFENKMNPEASFWLKLAYQTNPYTGKPYNIPAEAINSVVPLVGEGLYDSLSELISDDPQLGNLFLNIPGFAGVNIYSSDKKKTTFGQDVMSRFGYDKERKKGFLQENLEPFTKGVSKFF